MASRELNQTDPGDEQPRRHDCNEWRMEGIGCAECNPTAAAIRDCWDDPVRLERNGLRSLLRDAEGENARLREQVAALRDVLETISDGYTGPGAIVARRVLAETEDWRKEEAARAYGQGLGDT